MPNQTLKVGILGPRTYLLGSHSRDDEPRRGFNHKIRDALVKLNESYRITGYTGLALGIEQDFAHICGESGIAYHVMLPYDSQESGWLAMPTVVDEYNRLLAGAETVSTLSGGGYTPRKVLIKSLEIIECTDKVLVVRNGLWPLKSSISECLTLNAEKVINL